MVQTSFRGALRVFQGDFKEVKKCFKCFNDVSKIFQGDFTDVSFVLQGCLNYGCFMDEFDDVSSMF